LGRTAPNPAETNRNCITSGLLLPGSVPRDRLRRRPALRAANRTRFATLVIFPGLRVFRDFVVEISVSLFLCG
jgi:hypothetical protein